MPRPLLAAVLASLLSGVARAGPAVPEDALKTVPATLRVEWERRQDVVAALTSDVQAVHSAWALQQARDAAEAARRDLDATRLEASNLATRARADLQRVQMARTDARIEVDTAKLEERCAEDARRTARGRARVREARGELAEARDALHEARRARAEVRRTAGRTERQAEHQLRVSERAVEAAKEALNEVGAVGTGLYQRRVGPRELALLEARRDLAAAELERDRALAAIQLGARFALRPYVEAVEAARAALAAADASLETSNARPST